ncbi:hypothetical protein KAFR_0B03690 [Kazachstania africana CBS 2517]|uniref:inorganic diphosphatase n=1 Tax=Kazachstania africana (strain ATCC 22294 / BCRC 22015 / CBS 2517 / CECT 1963 / NBRC 1671 / NRRL Y-8276) TaxID=1071382 RepID=H2AQL6_KAZAF|nr:hypothetical protein KAFR_0B03690 [Kazachstania africana CBS 2517]CCF56666.1 hypothetical protein KAFR_0B03690 [Kazachstania africana CBS 2517]
MSGRLLGVARVFRSTQYRCFSTVRQGIKYTPTFKQYLQMPNNEVGSYFHDVPLEFSREGATINMVVEIPRWTNAKFEISKNLRLNPIVQDSKNGKLRYVNNIFPFNGYIHNYGAIPQTWEDPTELDTVLGLNGDNDPLDCCEIGSTVLGTGTIYKVKVLGSLALIDDTELDWKVIVIRCDDPLAKEISSLSGVEKCMPGLLEHTREWFRKYKIPQGKPANTFAYNGEYRNVEETLNVIEKCHASWRKLISDQIHEDSAGLPQIMRTGSSIILEDENFLPATIPKKVQRWFYV